MASGLSLMPFRRCFASILPWIYTQIKIRGSSQTARTHCNFPYKNTSCALPKIAVLPLYLLHLNSLDYGTCRPKLGDGAVKLPRMQTMLGEGDHRWQFLKRSLLKLHIVLAYHLNKICFTAWSYCTSCT